MEGRRGGCAFSASQAWRESVVLYIGLSLTDKQIICMMPICVQEETPFAIMIMRNQKGDQLCVKSFETTHMVPEP